MPTATIINIVFCWLFKRLVFQCILKPSTVSSSLNQDELEPPVWLCWIIERQCQNKIRLFGKFMWLHGTRCAFEKWRALSFRQLSSSKLFTSIGVCWPAATLNGTFLVFIMELMTYHTHIIYIDYATLASISTQSDSTYATVNYHIPVTISSKLFYSLWQTTHALTALSSQRCLCTRHV